MLTSSSSQTWCGAFFAGANQALRKPGTQITDGVLRKTIHVAPALLRLLRTISSPRRKCGHCGVSISSAMFRTLCFVVSTHTNDNRFSRALERRDRRDPGKHTMHRNNDEEPQRVQYIFVYHLESVAAKTHAQRRFPSTTQGYETLPATGVRIGSFDHVRPRKAEPSIFHPL